MSIKTYITDPKCGLEAEVVNGDEKNALVVATRPLKTYTNRPSAFLNPTYGNDMAQNALAGGNPEQVHDGTDNTEADSGTTDGTTADKLVDSGQNFNTTVESGMTVHNTTDDTYALVTAVDSDTTLSLDTDIMISGENYTVGAYWVASDVTGDAHGHTTFDSTDENHTSGGSKSIEIDGMHMNDVIQFAKGSDLDCNDYVSLILWVYVDEDWGANDEIEIYGWDTGTSLQIGDAVNLQDYFNWNTYGIWQRISIPLTDMGALATSTTLDALRIHVTKTGEKPKAYFDDIQFAETGAPIEYTIVPDLGTWLHVHSISIQIADDYTGILENATMPKIPFHQFFGEKIISPIVYARYSNNEIVNSATILSVMDIMGFSNATITGQGSDGTNSWIVINITPSQPIILKSEDNDRLSLTISDDLSGLQILKASAACKQEDRSDIVCGDN